MSQIATVALSNTFDYWRLRSNEVINRLNQFAINESKLYANTVQANNVLKSTGNTVLGAAGKQTVINGLITSNGRMTISKNLSVSGNTSSNKLTITSRLVSSGNNVLGAAGKPTIINGVITANGTLTVSTNLTVSGNAIVGGLKANNSLGTSNYVLRTNGTTIFWGAVTNPTSLVGLNNTWTGNNTFNGTFVDLNTKELRNSALVAWREKVYTATVTTATDLDLSLYNVFNITLGASVTLTLINPPSAGVTGCVVYLTQDATGGRVVTWAGKNYSGGSITVSWPSATTPTISSDPNRLDILGFQIINGVTRYFGAFGPSAYVV